MTLDKIGDQIIEAAKAAGIAKSQVRVTETTTHEFEFTNEKIGLYRTTFDQRAELKGLHESKLGQASGNEFSTEAIQSLVRQTQAGIEASPADPAYDICQEPVKKNFVDLPADTSMEQLFDETALFLNQARAKYPKVAFESSALRMIKGHQVVKNSEGLGLASQEGHLDASIMFSGKDGQKSSSFSFVSFTAKEPFQNLIALPGLQILLDQAVQQLDAETLPAGFQGDVVLTPYFLSGFLGSILEQMSTTALMSGTSVFQSKLGEKVFSDKFTLVSDPLSKNFATKSFYSSEGYLNETVPFFENGVLKNFLINDYGSRKLKMKRTPSDGSHLRVSPGETPFDQMIKGIDKGLLVTRFSGGRPSSNGDFSGVAKSSFLIENGKVTRPVKEVMISGNFVEMFKNVVGISRDTLNFGSEEFPWIHSKGVHIS